MGQYRSTTASATERNNSLIFDKHYKWLHDKSLKFHWNVDIPRQVKAQKRGTEICQLMDLTKCILEYSVQNMLASLVGNSMKVVISSFEIGTLRGAIGWME